MMEKADQMRYAATALATLGLVALALWIIINDGSATSMLLLLSGIGVMVLAILLYFFSPSRYLRADVSGALAISDTLSINSMLSALLVTSRGIHFPTGQTGAPKLFLPLSGVLSPGEIASLKPERVRIRGFWQYQRCHNIATRQGAFRIRAKHRGRIHGRRPRE